MLDAAIEATRAGVTGARRRDWRGVNDGATATRALAPTESRGYPTFGVVGEPGAMPSTRVRTLTQSEMDSLTNDPSFENVKRILSRLEVK